MITYSLLLAFRARETLNKANFTITIKENENLDGYDRVFKDHPYVIFTFLIALGMIAPSMLWTLLAIYTKQNFSLPENLFGWPLTTNVLMFVFVQLFVTQISRHFRVLPVAAVGMAMYAFGVGSVAFMSNF